MAEKRQPTVANSEEPVEADESVTPDRRGSSQARPARKPMLSGSAWGRIGAALGALATIMTLVSIALDLPQQLGLARRPFSPASEGEVLVIVTDFVGSEGAAASSRIVRALDRRVQESGLENVRIEALPGEAPRRAEEAMAIGQQYNATLVIWGVYDGIVVEPFYEVVENQASIETRVSLGATAAGLPTFSAYVVEGLPHQFEYLMLFSLGQLAYFSQDYEQAISLFDEAVAAIGDPGEGGQSLGLDTLYFYRGFSNRRLGHNEAAIQDYGAVIALNPEFVRAYKNRGTAYYYLGDYEAAIADYGRAIELDPTDSGTYYNRGLAYFASGDPSLALADYNHVITHDSDFIPAYINRGLIYMESGQYDDALSDFDRAIALNPPDDLLAITYNNMAYTFVLMDENYDEALGYANQAVALAPEFEEAYHTRGAVYMGMGDVERAIADFDAALAIDSSLPHAYRDRGWAYAQQENMEAALADLDWAIALSPGDALSYYYRGTVHDSLGHTANALSDYALFLDGYGVEDERADTARARIEALETP
jgi:tetratricopeptide (TPR) repeat protein